MSERLPELLDAKAFQAELGSGDVARARKRSTASTGFVPGIAPVTAGPH